MVLFRIFINVIFSLVTAKQESPGFVRKRCAFYCLPASLMTVLPSQQSSLPHHCELLSQPQQMSHIPLFSRKDN